VASASESAPFHILTLDGGGIKGLATAAILAKLEEDLDTKITDHFDLLAGTSTGGIVAIGLGLGLRPAQILDFYVEKGPQIFCNPAKIRDLLQWVWRKYPTEPLEQALREVFADKLLGDSKKPLVIPAYDLDREEVYLFKTPHHDRLNRDWKTPAWKVALATSAAPTFFSAHTGVDSVRLIDGGIWANNPVIVAVTEAVSMFKAPLESIRVLSIGTTRSTVVRGGWLNNGGRLVWATAAVEVIMKAQSFSANTQAIHLLGKDKVHRLNSVVPGKLFGMDKFNKRALESWGATMSRNFSPTFKDVFMPHLAGKYTPLQPRKVEAVS
jgi:patatin-like phospholipase/acyl hydrolase